MDQSKIEVRLPVDLKIQKPMKQTQNPSLVYKFPVQEAKSCRYQGSFRWIQHQGRTGIHATSVHSRIKISRHGINQKQGAVSLWAMALEEMNMQHSSSASETVKADPNRYKQSEPHFQYYTLLSDQKEIRRYDKAHFALGWNSDFYPMLYTKFGIGSIYMDMYEPLYKPFLGAGHFHWLKEKWYQFLVTWDEEKGLYTLAVNGIVANRQNPYHPYSSKKEACGKTLYLGNPRLVLSDLTFHDRFLNDSEIKNAFLSEGGKQNSEETQSTQSLFRVKKREKFKSFVTPEWKTHFEDPLSKKNSLSHFYIQGRSQHVQQTSEGIKIETPSKSLWKGDTAFTEMVKKGYDPLQVYIWLTTPYEGDVSISYEFKPLKNGGLSLLMTNACGMQGENFLADHPKRTTGSMSVVCWENVRNYHWEYFREVRDARQDAASHVLMKNPWFHPLHYSCDPQLLKINQWHQISWEKKGNHVQGAIDGKTIFDFEDDSDPNHGASTSCGTIAIRCMIETSMLFRNLKIKVKPPQYKILKHKN